MLPMVKRCQKSLDLNLQRVIKIMKTNELTGLALDWAVAKCEFHEPDYEPQDWLIYITEGCNDAGWVFAPSTDWAQGGPIIEREGIAVVPAHDGWKAVIDLDEGDFMVQTNHGPTPLIAAMRCYVASKLGDEVEIPAELTTILDLQA
jgi:hypothetical protein